MSVNPINVNPQGINGAFGFGAKPKAKEEEKSEQQQEAQANNAKALSADEVFNYMAQTAVSVKPAYTSIDPSKYVDEKSAERIAGFMANFEDKVAEGLAAFNKEFEDVKISDSTKMSIVLAGL
jgi:hypothetical protein